uniref:Uncharacterized protein n=1 Tax=Glossina austeni TaxID=7395 RepID=A0A1A9UDZ7_GLOAU
MNYLPLRFCNREMAENCLSVYLGRLLLALVIVNVDCPAIAVHLYETFYKTRNTPLFEQRLSILSFFFLLKEKRILNLLETTTLYSQIMFATENYDLFDLKNNAQRDYVSNQRP